MNMELSDCPPGAEGYEDTVTEVAKKPVEDDATSTKAEKEFFEHLSSLKIKCEDGTYRCMVERRGRHIGGKWLYICFPCEAICSGELVLQTHISGKKHKTKLASLSVWPLNIFDNHPVDKMPKFDINELSEQTLKKMAEEVDLHNKPTSDLDKKFNKFKENPCYIQENFDAVRAPLVGLEYVLELLDMQYDPTYLCLLCNKQGQQLTIVNHLTSHWHRYNFVHRHFPSAMNILMPYTKNNLFRDGVRVVISRLVQRMEDTFGRMKPISMQNTDFERDKDKITQWVFKGYHFSEKEGNTFVEVVDLDLITKLNNDLDTRDVSKTGVSAVKNKNLERAASMEPISEDSDDDGRPSAPRASYSGRSGTARGFDHRMSSRYHPYDDKRRESPHRSTFSKAEPDKKRVFPVKPKNYDHKMKLLDTQVASLKSVSVKTLSYHEKNPEKHPLYPEEWKKFWNKRYKEIQADGKDPTKHDFKPEWIVFWTKRMKELHEKELRGDILEIYRRMRITPPPDHLLTKSPDRQTSKSQSSSDRRRSPEWRRSQERRRSPERRRSHERRRYSPSHKHLAERYRIDHRYKLPSKSLRTRSRSPHNKSRGAAPHSPVHSGAVLISSDEDIKNDDLSPWNSGSSLDSVPDTPAVYSRDKTSSSRSIKKTKSYLHYEPAQGPTLADLGPTDNVVATLRILVALEDYLGSLGPKIVDLLSEALSMEKERGNSSEELTRRPCAVSLLETAKERLKGAAQAGLVAPAAAPAVRAAVVRVAALLHASSSPAAPLSLAPSLAPLAPLAPLSLAAAAPAPLVARQIAAALVAQGKTDVSAEELAQLVDAVVGTAETKKQNEMKISTPSSSISVNSQKSSAKSASALQLLQSAYNEHDKKPETEETNDVMDGLSDSDLETLLKNFNELSAEEQHSLIGYLKKLEAREPQRVERLRAFVGAVPASAPEPEPVPEPKPAAPEPVINRSEVLRIDSDDDDYTVEEVFKSATQKVKEDQIRQEMEVVKKSLEEAKTVTPEPEPSPAPILELNLPSASQLLALVQASLTNTSPASLPTANVSPRPNDPTQDGNSNAPMRIQANDNFATHNETKDRKYLPDNSYPPNDQWESQRDVTSFRSTEQPVSRYAPNSTRPTDAPVMHNSGFGQSLIGTVPQSQDSMGNYNRNQAPIQNYSRNQDFIENRPRNQDFIEHLPRNQNFIEHRPRNQDFIEHHPRNQPFTANATTNQAAVRSGRPMQPPGGRQQSFNEFNLNDDYSNYIKNNGRPQPNFGQSQPSYDNNPGSYRNNPSNYNNDNNFDNNYFDITNANSNNHFGNKRGNFGGRRAGASQFRGGRRGRGRGRGGQF